MIEIEGLNGLSKFSLWIEATYLLDVLNLAFIWIVYIYSCTQAMFCKTITQET